MPKRKVVAKTEEDDDDDGDEEIFTPEVKKPRPIVIPSKLMLTRSALSSKQQSFHPMIYSLRECLAENDKYLVFVRYLQRQSAASFLLLRLSDMTELMTQLFTLSRFHRGHLLGTIFQELTRLLIDHPNHLMVAVIRLMSALITRVQDKATIFSHCVETIWKPFLNMNTQPRPSFPFHLLSPETSVSPFLIREVLPIYAIEYHHILAHLLSSMPKGCPLAHRWIVYYLLQQYIQQLQEYPLMDAVWMTFIQTWSLESTLDVDFISLMLIPLVGWLHQEEHRQTTQRLERERERKQDDPPLPPLSPIALPPELRLPWSWFYEVASGVDQDALKSKRWNAVILSGIRPTHTYCSDLSKIAPEEVQLFTITWESRAFTVWRDYGKGLLEHLPRELAYSILEMRSKYSSQEVLGKMYNKRKR